MKKKPTSIQPRHAMKKGQTESPLRQAFGFFISTVQYALAFGLTYIACVAIAHGIFYAQSLVTGKEVPLLVRGGIQGLEGLLLLWFFFVKTIDSMRAIWRHHNEHEPDEAGEKK